METSSNRKTSVGGGVVSELLLGVNGACFVCFQQLNNCNNNTEKVDRHELSFRSICRYLRIDTKSILLQVLGSDCPSEFLTSHVTVVLCEKCNKITKCLSQFLRQSEVLQMQVDYHLQQFYKSLNEFKENDEVKKSRITEAAIVEANILDCLRSETLRNCDALIKQKQRATFPIVLIDRLTEEVIEENRACKPQPTPVSPDPLPTNLDASDTVTAKPNKITSGKLDCVQNLPDFYNIASSLNLAKSTSQTAPPSVESVQWLSKTLDACFVKLKTEIAGRPKVRCRNCPDKTLLSSNAKWHLLSQHPDKLFSRERLEGVTVEQLKLCSALLFQEELQSATKGEIKDRHCKYCPWKGSAYAVHLVTRHFSVLAERLTNLQSTKSWEQEELNDPLAPTRVRKLCFKKSKIGKKLACRFCQIEITSTSTKLHIINFHPEKLFLESKLENVSKEQFLICCHHLFRIEINKAVMTVGKREWKCAHCSWIGTKYKYHLVGDHLSLLESELKKYQQKEIWKMAKPDLNPPLRKNLLTKKIGRNRTKYYRPRNSKCPITQVMTSLYTKGEIRTDKQRPTKYCSVCKIQVINEMAHLVRQHLEECFVERKLANISDANFQACCSRALYTVDNQAKVYREQEEGKRGKEIRLECKFCEYGTYRDQSFLDHVLKTHYPLVEQMLMEEQNKCVPTHKHSAMKRENPETTQSSSPKKDKKRSKTFSTNPKCKNTATTSTVTSTSAVRSKKKKGNKGRKKVPSFTFESRNNYRDVMSSMLATGKLADLKGSKKTKLEIMNCYSMEHNNLVSSPGFTEEYKNDTNLVQLEVYGEEEQEAAELNEVDVKSPVVKNETTRNFPSTLVKMETMVNSASENENISMTFYEELPRCVKIKTEVDLNE